MERSDARLGESLSDLDPGVQFLQVAKLPLHTCRYTRDDLFKAASGQQLSNQAGCPVQDIRVVPAFETRPHFADFSGDGSDSLRKVIRSQQYQIELTSSANRVKDGMSLRAKPHGTSGS